MYKSIPTVQLTERRGEIYNSVYSETKNSHLRLMPSIQYNINDLIRRLCNICNDENDIDTMYPRNVFEVFRSSILRGIIYNDRTISSPLTTSFILSAIPPPIFFPRRFAPRLPRRALFLSPPSPPSLQAGMIAAADPGRA